MQPATSVDACAAKPIVGKVKLLKSCRLRVENERLCMFRVGTLTAGSELRMNVCARCTAAAQHDNLFANYPSATLTTA